MKCLQNVTENLKERAPKLFFLSPSHQPACSPYHSTKHGDWAAIQDLQFDDRTEPLINKMDIWKFLTKFDRLFKVEKSLYLFDFWSILLNSHQREYSWSLLITLLTLTLSLERLQVWTQTVKVCIPAFRGFNSSLSFISTWICLFAFCL